MATANPAATSAPAPDGAAPKPAEDPFAAAFTQFSEEPASPVIEDTKSAAAPAEPATIEIEGVLPDPKKVAADGTTTPEPAKAAAADPAADPAAKEGSGGAPAAARADPAPAAKVSDDDLLARFREILAEPAKAAASDPATPAPAIAPFSAEEQAVVDNFRKEWPDVDAAQMLIRSREYQGLVKHIFDQIRPHLEAVQGRTAEMAQQTHVQQLQAAVPDYAEVAPKVLEWIGRQPDYLKAAYTHVAQQGAVADVVDLIGRYRAETGTAAPAAAPAGGPPTASAAPPAAAPAKAVVDRIAKGLAPVGGKRSGVQGDAVDKDDFKGAFDAFAKMA